MVTEYIRARDVLKARLEKVFAEPRFSETYPLAAKAPAVYLGFPVTEPPFYAAVDEIAETAAATGAATMGHAQIDFTMRVFLCSQHTDLKRASDTLLSYIDAVFGAVLADQRLNMSVDNSFPSIESAGTAADSSKRYIAACYIAVACTVSSVCPASLAEAVEEADRDFEG